MAEASTPASSSRASAFFFSSRSDRPVPATVTYDEFISDVVRGVEALGAAIMVLGGLAALVAYLIAVARPADREGAYERLRERLGRAILLGLEVLIVGDIVRTIIVDPTVESVLVLGMIVVIRIVLSFSLEVEIDGTWPWSRWRLAGPAPKDAGEPPK
ncbi:MAG: DUF1622 domain-containing protein [Acidimicrobiales bacterium]|nr:DUF1622 domain-containing protein [Acidimicrobiales bacterium]